MKKGAALGAATGAAASARQAHLNGKNIVTGNDRAVNVGSNKPNQVHHFASDKNKAFTPDMEKIANKYGLDLNGDWNKQSLPHQGRHPNDYHKFVLKQMQIIDAMPGMNQQQFIQQFNIRVIQPVNNNPGMLYKNYWNP